MKTPFSAILLIWLALVAGPLSAQNNSSHYLPRLQKAWQQNRSLTKLRPYEKEQAEVVLWERVYIEPQFHEERGLQRYYSEHRRIRINESSAVEQNNRIYLPASHIYELVALKARVIKPDGQVVETDSASLKEKHIDQGGGNFKILAVEGLEPGCELEYFYTAIKQMEYFARSYVQSSSYKREYRLQIASPSNLVFEAKVYNSPAQPESEEGLRKRFLRVKLDSVPPIREEEYSFTRANRIRIEYQITKNTAQGEQRLLDWEQAGQHYFQQIHEEEKKQDETVRDYMQEHQLPQENAEAAIRAIEHHFKMNFSRSRQASASVEEALENKYANQMGLLRAQAAMLREAGVNYSLVLTSKRNNVPFDKDFDSWNYLEDFLFYFPDYNTFYAPTAADTRYPQIPSMLSYTDGLFINVMKMGGEYQYVTYRDYIPGSDAEDNFTEMQIRVGFDQALSEATLHLSEALHGKDALQVRPYLEFMEPEKQKQTVKSMLKSSAENADVDSVRFQHWHINDNEKPLVLSGVIKSKALLESAGPRRIFNLGKVIGPQVELYQEKPRQNPVQLRHPHAYYRTIAVEVPDGYRIQGAEALKMDISYQDEDGEPMMGFKSDYTLGEDSLQVEIEEYYHAIHYPLKRWEDFRSVINAAADFNKIAVFFKKE